jgi:hypothetical protein
MPRNLPYLHQPADAESIEYPSFAAHLLRSDRMHAIAIARISKPIK